MPISRIDKQKSKEEFRKDIFTMLMVWKTKQQALKIIKDNGPKIESWVDGKGNPIVTAAVAARLLIIKETNKAPESSEVRNI